MMDLLVADVLEEVGWPLGYNGHTTCPIHHGDNKTAFHYKGELWHCFSRCGRGGNAYQLRQELVFEIPKPCHAIRGFVPPVNQPDHELKPLLPSQLLHLKVNERRQTRTEKLISQHQYGVDLTRMGHEIHHLDPELAERTMWAGMEIVQNAQRELDGEPLAR